MKTRSSEAHTPKTPKNNLDRGDWHVSHSSMGMGDYYGSGIRNPMGKIRKGMGMGELTDKQVGTPPRSLA